RKHKTIQKRLQRLCYAVWISTPAHEAFSIRKRTFRLHVIFEGHPVVLEADIAQATDADDPESLWGYIAECAAPNFAISNGDYFLTLTFRSDPDQVRAGLYLAAAMILAFDGDGFENQSDTHGGSEFAHQLIAEASDASAFEDP